MKRIALAVLLAALAFPALGTMLYKSVGPTGTVMFSDVPPPADSRIVEQRAITSTGGPAAASSSGGIVPITQLIDFDAAVAQASSQVDLAEHALAVARRDLWSPRDGLKLASRPLTLADRDRLEFYKRNVQIARQALMELLRERMVASR